MFDGGNSCDALAGTPGPGLVAALDGVALGSATDAEVLAAVGGWERVIAWATARQARAVAEFAQRRPSRDGAWIDEFAASELATELCLTSAGASNKVGFARSLESLPLTAAALAAGSIDPRRAQVIIDGVAHVDKGVAATVEAQVIGRAPSQTSGQVRAALARAVIAADPSGADRRHALARGERRVEIRPAEDGMASLWALLPAEGAAGVRAALDRAARAAKTPDDVRSADNRRADALVALCTGLLRPPSTEVRVVIDAGTLLRLQQQPAYLVGYGPVPPALARALAGDARWRRMVIAPQTGELLDLGRRTYRPSDALARFVQARDLTCRFPGCRRPAHADDADHVIPFPAGETVRANLVALCRHHHRLKTHASGWSARRDADGSVWWTTPTGKAIAVEPDPDAPGRPEPHPPPPEVPPF